VGRPQRGGNTGATHLAVTTTTPTRRTLARVSVSAAGATGGTRLTFTDGQSGTLTADDLGEAAVVLASLTASNLNAQAAASAAATAREEELEQRLVELRAEGTRAADAALALTVVTSVGPSSDVEKLCHLLLPPGPDLTEALRIRGGSISAIGQTSASVAEMSERSQGDLARLTALLLKGLLTKVKGGAADPAGVLELLLGQRKGLDAELKAALFSKTGVGPLTHPLCVELKLAICRCKRLGLRDIARQLFSIVTAASAAWG
jgi:hypothetical protein